MWSIADLIEKTDARLARGNMKQPVSSVASLTDATAGQLSFYLNRSYRDSLTKTAASVILADKKLIQDCEDLLPKTCALLLHDRAADAFITLLELFASSFVPFAATTSQASINETAQIGDNVTYGRVSITKDCIIGDNCVLADGVCLGEGTHLGADCILYPNVVLYPHTSLGNRVIIHAGAVIGCDGFGYDSHKGTHRKIPHIGRVVIEDDVEIGANSCIDRGTLGITRIGRGSKLDNLVQIGHNVDLGERALLCGQVGIGGSVRIGDGTIMAGKAGVIDHIKLGKDNRVYAASIVCNDTKEKAHLFGRPARAKAEVLREQVLVRKLPQLFKRLLRLEKKE